jgi:hypothetical protein
MRVAVLVGLVIFPHHKVNVGAAIAFEECRFI